MQAQARHRHAPAAAKRYTGACRPTRNINYTLPTRWSAGIVGRAAQQETSVLSEEEELFYSGESFYDILGVPANASTKTIKKAYLGIMKECHPDRSIVEANEFCALLNEIYETLSDPDRRATYDAMSGFSFDSINPFMDTTFERDQVFVDEFACIGCRACCGVCPSTFMMEEDFGRARVYRQNADIPEKQQEAIDICPVSCIHWVTSPQLSLLEAAMARMERVSVWSMALGGASNKNVFTEASLAWQKRFSDMQSRRAAFASTAMSSNGNGYPTPPPPKKSGWAGWFSNVVSFDGASGSGVFEQAQKARARAEQRQQNGSSSGSDTDNEGSNSSYDSSARQPLSDKEARNIAALSARAARASRTWKIMQQTSSKFRKQQLSISSVSSVSSVSSMEDV